MKRWCETDEGSVEKCQDSFSEPLLPCSSLGSVYCSEMGIIRCCNQVPCPTCGGTMIAGCPTDNQLCGDPGPGHCGAGGCSLDGYNAPCPDCQGAKK